MPCKKITMGSLLPLRFSGIANSVGTFSPWYPSNVNFVIVWPLSGESSFTPVVPSTAMFNGAPGS